MKKILTIAVAAMLAAGCGASKTQKTAPLPATEMEIMLPCGEYTSDADFFRGMGIGQSKDPNTAREKARMNANAELATGISAMVKRVAERYVNDAGQRPTDYAETFESLTREVVQQQISNTIVACSKLAQTQDGMYKCYMAIEAAKDQIFAALDARMSADKKMQTLFEREKFRKEFDAEMEAFGKQ